jgi:alpha-D-ribose 1-methylphosphonate 5-triphosphate synthase subunit PhnI
MHVLGKGDERGIDHAHAKLAEEPRGNLIGGVLLIHAYRTTLPRFGAFVPVDTACMAVIQKLQGGQMLGPRFDYTPGLLDFKPMAEGQIPSATAAPTADLRDLPLGVHLSGRCASSPPRRPSDGRASRTQSVDCAAVGRHRPTAAQPWCAGEGAAVGSTARIDARDGRFGDHLDA